ncbi:MAG: Asp-tRNA(Asn)/Glu-tRNA(Gln) amidotransferase subunit GatB [Firmicutes bacterium]|nr:Asp-tRNA(Asn)/Glu-tRNA(Gln) amidotransferase subunit GatB [Bacillota bacterium]
MNYDIVVGLEIHAELDTNTKLMCSCPNDTSKNPNTNVCPTCTAQPGALPSVNRVALERAILAGHAFDCKINDKVFFERKHYYYPDLPSGYQLTQLEKPQCIGGHVILKNGKKIRLNRIHVEENAGKLLHDEVKGQTLVDFNRAGVPLIEIVTEPDISSAEEAMEFMEQVRSRLVFSGAALCKMEDGGLRCDVNISLKPKGATKFGNRVELKNLNSFKMVGRAIEFETKRQSNLLDNDREVAMETRKWNDNRGMSTAMRSKETELDYAYTPCPDIPAILVPQKIVIDIKENMPKLAHELFIEFTKNLGIPEYDADIITREKSLSDFYLESIQIINEPKKVSNWLLTDVLARAKSMEILITPKQFTDIINLVDSKKISKKNSLDLLDSIWGDKNQDIEKAANAMGIIGGVLDSEIEKIISELIKNNQQAASDYKTTPDKVINFFMGQTMKATGGKADSVKVREIVLSKLKN